MHPVNLDALLETLAPNDFIRHEGSPVVWAHNNGRFVTYTYGLLDGQVVPLGDARVPRFDKRTEMLIDLRSARSKSWWKDWRP